MNGLFHILTTPGGRLNKSAAHSWPFFVDFLLVSFIWLNLVFLCGLGSLGKIAPENIAQFVSCATLLICTAACLNLFVPSAGSWRAFSLFLCYAGLVFLPLHSLVLDDSRLMLLLDLYYLFLLTMPAFLSLWSWQLQVAAGLAALTAVSVLWLPVGSAEALHSISLLLVATVLSSFVTALRVNEPVLELQTIALKGQRLVEDVFAHRLPRMAWNVILLEAGLLLLLIFVDASMSSDELTGLLARKGYGFVVLLFGAMLIRISRREYLGYAVVLTTVILSGVLSGARLEYQQVHYLLLVLPLCYLVLIVLALPVKLELQIAAVWLIFQADLTTKVLHELAVENGLMPAVAAALQLYKSELFAVIAITSVAALAARSIQRSRIVNFFHFAEQYQGMGGEAAPVAGGESMRIGAKGPAHFARAAIEAIEPERRRLLTVGIILLGVLSCITSSRLLADFGAGVGELSVLVWLIFLALWTLILFLERKNVSDNVFWMFAALTEVVLTLWPCVLLLYVPQPGNRWLLWPAFVLLGLGAVPWATKELIPLLLVSCFAGLEIVYRLDLGVVVVLVYAAAAVLAVLCSIQGAQRMKEKSLLLKFPLQVRECQTLREIGHLLADYLLTLFNSSAALSSASSEDLELIRNGRIFSLAKDKWPLADLGRSFPTEQAASSGCFVGSINWLPAKWGFVDDRFGFFSAAHGLFVAIYAGEPALLRQQRDEKAAADAGSAPQKNCLRLLVTSRIPVLNCLRTNELRTAETLVASAKRRIDELVVQEFLEHRERSFERRLQEREYELNALVHDINNTVQDLTLLCDTVLEDLLGENRPAEPLDSGSATGELCAQIRRVANIARSVALVVSDAKRRRELERLPDLRPREMVEVSRVIREIASFSVIRAERKRVEVDFSCTSDEEVWVRISAREHLEAILRNLLNNAIAYSKPGAIVRVELHASKDWVRVEVVDNGPGFAPEEQEAIFRSGFRGKSSLGVSGGLGLGLAESRRIAEAGGGELTAFSAGEGGGASFTLSLPRVNPPVQSSFAASWALIVDDQPALGEMYARLLRALSLMPLVAHSVADALVITKEKGRPSIVLTDIHLGEVSGLELVKSLRAEYGLALPILVISGLTDADIAEQARSAGATDFVAKPIGRQALYARIQSLLPASERGEYNR